MTPDAGHPNGRLPIEDEVVSADPPANRGAHRSTARLQGSRGVRGLFLHPHEVPPDIVEETGWKPEGARGRAGQKSRGRSWRKRRDGEIQKLVQVCAGPLLGPRRDIRREAPLTQIPRGARPGKQVGASNLRT